MLIDLRKVVGIFLSQKDIISQPYNPLSVRYERCLVLVVGPNRNLMELGIGVYETQQGMVSRGTKQPIQLT